MEHLARSRAEACKDALVEAGVPEQRLVVTFKALQGAMKVDFIPVPPGTDAGSFGVLPAECEFTVHKAPQEVEVRLARATGDVNVRFHSLHPDPDHWTHSLVVPNGTRITITHAALGCIVSSGVVESGHCFIGGADTLYSGEEYVLAAQSDAHFERAEVRFSLRPGAQDVWLCLAWYARPIQLYVMSAEETDDSAEAYAQVQKVLRDNDVFFNGAGEADLPRPDQAWSVEHTDNVKAAGNRKTFQLIAAVLRMFPQLRCEVYGQTGPAVTAPVSLADYLDLHPTRDVAKCMDALARLRAEACMKALVEAGVPASQLFITYKGLAGELKVDFIPRSAHYNPTGAGASSDLPPLPPKIPFELWLKTPLPAGRRPALGVAPSGSPTAVFGTLSGAYINSRAIEVRGHPHPTDEGLCIFAAHDGTGETKMVGANLSSYDAEKATLRSDHHRIDPGLVDLFDTRAVVAAYESARRELAGQTHTVMEVKFGEGRLAARGASRLREEGHSAPLIIAGETLRSHTLVQCPLPDGAALIVGQEYMFKALIGAGTEANSATFYLDPEAEADRVESRRLAVGLEQALSAGEANVADAEAFATRAAVVKLPLKRSRFGAVRLNCHYELPATAPAEHAAQDALTRAHGFLGRVLSDAEIRRAFVQHARKRSGQLTVDLTTGSAPWTLAKACGTRFPAGAAPTTTAHTAWFKPQGFSWLGNSAAWPPGDVILELLFDVADPEAAQFELPYAVDNALKSATLNDRPLDVGLSKGFKTFGGEMAIRAPVGRGLFVRGRNLLRVTVSNAGATANPMGFCARGRAVVGFAPTTPPAGTASVLADASLVRVFEKYARKPSVSSGLSEESVSRAFQLHARSSFSAPPASSLSEAAVDRVFQRFAAAAQPAPGQTAAVELTTGVASWTLASSHGRFKAGTAPTTPAHAAWYKPRSGQGSWLGHSTHWPPGDVVFELQFGIPAHDFAEPTLELPYAVDNSLKGATLNGSPLNIGTSKGFKALGGDMVIRTLPGQGLFKPGTNLLRVVVSNAGARENPMGFYCAGRLTLSPKGAVAGPVMSTRDVRTALLELGIAASESQAAAVLRKYDDDNSGSLDVREFMRLAMDVAALLAPASGSGPPPAGSSMPVLAAQNLRLSLRELGVDATAAQARDVLRTYDADNSGSLDFSEFARIASQLAHARAPSPPVLATSDLRMALRELGVDATAAQTSSVLQRYDADSSGTLDLEEFSRLALALWKALGSNGAPPASDPSAAEPPVLGVSELRAALRDLDIDCAEGGVTTVLARYDKDSSGRLDLREFSLLASELSVSHAVRTAFSTFDRDRSGALSTRELRAALQTLKVDATDSQAAAVLREFDADGSGALSLLEFAQLCHRLVSLRAEAAPDVERHWSAQLAPVPNVEFKVLDAWHIARQIEDAKEALHLCTDPRGLAFHSDSSSVGDVASNQAALQGVARALEGSPFATLRVHGVQAGESSSASLRHFHSRFPREQMDVRCALSQARVLACKDALVAMGVASGRIAVSWAVGGEDRLTLSAEASRESVLPEGALSLLGPECALGTVRDGRSEPLDVYAGALKYGGAYVVHVPDTLAIGGCRASRLFRVDGDEHSIDLPLRRKTSPVHLVVRAAHPDGHWAARLPFPTPIRLVVRHKALGIAVEELFHRGPPGSCEWRATLRQDELFVGETYALQVEGTDGVQSVERETHSFLVAPVPPPYPGATPQPQELLLHLQRASRPLTVRLVNPFPTSHWAACLPVPNGVPLALVHEGNAALREVAREVAFDGLARLPALDVFVGETYTVKVPETALNDAAEQQTAITSVANGTVDVGVIRAARRIELYLTGDDQRSKADAARREVLSFMEDNDVFFGGAAERSVRESTLGIAQSWNINHTDAEKRTQNWKTIEGIADIMNRYPDIPCEVLGTTTSAKAAPAPLADYFGLDRTRDVRDIMYRLSRSRAEACQAALIERGVPAERLQVRAEPLTGETKVDFVPKANSPSGAAAGLPEGLPFRLLHVRSADSGVGEALRQIGAFTAENEVIFNGAGEDGLPRAEQAWDVAHLDAHTRASNKRTLAGVAKIMSDFPSMCLEVHGETGAASIAPTALAAHFGLDRTAGVQECMDRLAEHRARACAEALVGLGLSAERLIITFRGRGGSTEVRFTPRSISPYGPTPAGDWGEYALVYQGRTQTAGERVLCPLPEGSALFVDESYVLEMANPLEFAQAAEAEVRQVFARHTEAPAGGPSEETLRNAFIRSDRDRSGTLSKRELRATLEATGLAVSSDQAAQILKAYDADGSGALSLLEFIKLATDVSRLMATETGRSVMSARQMREAFRALGLNPTHAQTATWEGDGGITFREFSKFVADAGSVAAYHSTQPADPSGKVRTMGAAYWNAQTRFTVSSQSDRETPVVVELPVVLAQTNAVMLHCRQRSEPHHWTARLPLPSGLKFTLHLVLASATSFSPPSDAATLQRRAAEARERVKRFLEDNDVFFNGAAEVGGAPLGIPQAWSVDNLDAAKRAQNQRTLSGVAHIMKEYPDLPVEVLGQTGKANRAPAPLAEHFRLDRERDVGRIMDLLAKHRAEACLEALVAAGVPRAQMRARWQGMSGEMKVDFIPLAGGAGQAAELSHSPATRDTVQATPLCGGVLVPSGVGYASASIPPSNLQVGSTYEVRVAGSEHLAPGSARFVAAEEAQEVHVPLDRVLENVTLSWRWPPNAWFERMDLPTSVPITISHEQLGVVEEHVMGAASPRAELEQQAEAALSEVLKFMEDNDVFFNGAKERATRESSSGIAQAWAIDHLDGAKRAANWRTIEGISGILRRYPDIACQVHGTTTETKPPANELLADSFQMDRHRDVDAIMETLAHRRAEACKAALVARGVPERQLFVTAKGRQGQMKVDFIPTARRGGSAPAPSKRQFTLALPLGEHVAVACQPLGDRRWEPVPASQHEPCEFNVSGPRGGVAGTQVLYLSPPVAPVSVTILSAHHEGSGDGHVAHWLKSLEPKLPERIALEVRHEQAGAPVASATVSPGSATMLSDEGRFFVGQSYTLQLRDAVLEDAKRDFTVHHSGTSVRLLVRPRSTRLSLAFTCEGGVPPGLGFQIRSKRAPASHSPIATGRTPDSLTGRDETAEMSLSLPTEQQLVLGEAYVLTLEGSADGMIETSSLDFEVAQLDTRLIVKVGKRNQLRLMFLGPMPEASYGSGDGDDEVDAPRADASGVIPFLVRTTHPGPTGQLETVLRGEKAYADLLSAVLHVGLAVGEEFVVETARTQKWEALSVRFSMHATPKTVELRLKPAPPGAPQVEVRATNDESSLPEGHWARALPFPRNLGFVVRPADADRASKGSKESRPAALGLLSSDGVGQLAAGSLPSGARYAAMLARSGVPLYDALGLHEQQVTAAFEAGSVFEPSRYEFSTEPPGSTAPLTAALSLRRRTRDVRFRLVPAPSAAPQPLTISLTTGDAPWTQPQAHGRFAAGPAPTTAPRSAWYKPSAGSWLGDSAAWPAGDAVFELRFDLPPGYTEPALELLYAADNTLSHATLNDRPLDIGASRGFQTLGGVLRAPAQEGCFRLGTNVLQVTVANSGSADIPLGFYCSGQLALSPATAAAEPAPIGRGVRVFARHVGCGAVAVEGASTGNGSVVLRGHAALFVGERYDLHLAASPSPALGQFVVEDGPDPELRLPDMPATVEPAPLGWYDEQPSRSEMQSRTSSDVDRLSEALKRRSGGFGMGSTSTLLDVLGSRRHAELQELRVAYLERHRRELADDLAAAAPAFKGFATRLETQLLRSKPELDALTASKALERGEVLPLTEAICTSLPHSLVQLESAHRELFRESLADAIQRAAQRPRADAIAAVAPLLAELLARAAEASTAVSASEAVEADCRALHEAFLGRAERSSVPAEAARVLGSRDRAHLRRVDEAHARSYGAPLSQHIKGCMPDGPLRYALLLLLERAEDYYARKLHAAFHGIRKTPGVNLKTLGPSTRRTLTARLERTQSMSGLMTHDGTVIAIISSRCGRDLSGVAASYERLYRKPLVAEMRACMTFGSGASELCKLACAIVEGSPPYEA